MSATPITFVYPWVNMGPAARWDLLYSLRSIDEHYAAPHAALIVGDQPPTMGNGLLFHGMARRDHPRFRRCVDVCAKMAFVIREPMVTEEFVYLYDDTFFISMVDTYTMRTRLAQGILNAGPTEDGTDHATLKFRTEKALRDAGLTGTLYDFETHTPRLFTKERMREVYERFHPEEHHLLFSTLYYNWHWRTPEGTVEPPTLLILLDRWKIGFRNPPGNSEMRTCDIHTSPAEALAYYRDAMRGKVFLNLSVGARSAALLDAIKLKLPHPGPYETAATAAYMKFNNGFQQRAPLQPV